MSYPGHWSGKSYPFAEKQSVYSTAPADWASLRSVVANVSKFELEFRIYGHFRSNTPKKSYEDTLSSIYGFLLCYHFASIRWVWHWITHEGWYAIKQENRNWNWNLSIYRSIYLSIFFRLVSIHIYQPLRSGRIWQEVNFYAEFNKFEFRVFLLLD